jgi:ATP-dependent RNA helicase DeaD
VGHIDLLNKFCYIEVPEEDAGKVMKALNGTTYKGREVRCNDAEDTPKGEGSRKRGGQGRRDDDSRGDRQASRGDKQTGRRGKRRAEADNFQNPQHKFKKEDWMQFLNPKAMKLKGDEPDFSEEGWARRRPKKK